MGYVGLPLAFGRVMPTIGFDVVEEKIAAYKDGYDPTGEMEKALFSLAEKLHYSTNLSDISAADFIIVAVPTPVDNAHRPDLTPVVRASETVGRYMKMNLLLFLSPPSIRVLQKRSAFRFLRKSRG